LTSAADLAAAIAAALAPVLEEAEARSEARFRAMLREELARATEPTWLTPEAFGALKTIGLTPATIRGYAADGRLVAERRGRTWRIRSDSQIAPLAPRPADRDTPAARVEELLARPRRRRGGQP
jgi:hypothetical protein